MSFRTVSSASATMVFSETATARRTWPAAENCSLCLRRYRNHRVTIRNARNNSPGTIRYSAQSAKAARWCESPPSPLAGSFNHAIPLEQSTYTAVDWPRISMAHGLQDPCASALASPYPTSVPVSDGTLSPLPVPKIPKPRPQFPLLELQPSFGFHRPRDTCRLSKHIA